MTTPHIIIPAAGYGIRFSELGKHYPKCLLPYDDKPIIYHTIRLLKQKYGSDVQVTVVVRPEHLEHPLWQLIKGFSGVELKPFGSRMVEGPVNSMVTGLGAGWNLMVLSDIVPSKEILALLPTSPDDAIFVTEVDRETTQRWCMAKIAEQTDLVLFFDKLKPELVPIDAKAVSGIYSFSSGQDMLATVGNVNYAEFAEVFARYQRVHPFKLVEHAPKQVLDIGTLEQFLANRKTKPRAFNNLTYGELTVTKQSNVNPNKIAAEVSWYTTGPVPREYKPVLTRVDPEKASYTMELLSGHNLRDLALYYDRSYATWTKIFSSVNTFILTCKQYGWTGPFWRDIVKKTEERLGNNLIDLELPKRLDKGIRALTMTEVTTAYHGDLHFANMFWTGPKWLKVIDPRGEWMGHWMYDVAKLAHSVVGNYDYIDADLYSIVGDDVTYYDSGREEIIKAFKEQIWEPLLKTDSERAFVRILTASLFATMIPLHDDYRHKELFKREAIRLSELKNWPF